VTDHDDATVDVAPVSSTGGLVLPPPAHLASEARTELAEQLVEQARVEGVSLIGPGGMLSDLTKRVLEAGREVEMNEHLGYEKHATEGRDGGNSRNGTRSKTVLTEVGPVEIDVPRDRAGSFDPLLVRKRQRRLEGLDAMVISLCARGMTTGDIEAHLTETYGNVMSRETISKITDGILEEMSGWLCRPLDRIYPVVFIDAIHLKVRDGQVANRAFYTAIGVTVDGKRDILGIWASGGGEGAKFWLGVLTELRNRGVADVCIVVCDGLKGLPDAINTTWPGDRADLRAAPDPQHLPPRRPAELGEDGEGSSARLLRTDRGSCEGTPRRVLRALGRHLPRRAEPLGERVGRLRAVPRLRPRDPPRHLLDQRHREPARPDATSDPGPRALPQRASRDEVPLPRRAAVDPVLWTRGFGDHAASRASSNSAGVR
jgi:hypothetical protein